MRNRYGALLSAPPPPFKTEIVPVHDAAAAATSPSPNAIAKKGKAWLASVTKLYVHSERATLATLTTRPALAQTAPREVDMRHSCFSRAFLIALLLLIIAVSAMRGIAGAWSETPLAVVDWGLLGGELRGFGSSLLETTGGVFARLAAAVTHAVTAIPWRSALGAVTTFFAALGAGFVALVRDLGGAVVGLAVDLARGLAHLAADLWRGVIGQLRDLARGPSGQPLDPSRLALFAGGWLVLLALVAWFAIRIFGRWLRAAWDRLVRRGCSSGRRRSPLRA